MAGRTIGAAALDTAARRPEPEVVFTRETLRDSLTRDAHEYGGVAE